MEVISVSSQQRVVENLIIGVLQHLNGRSLFYAQLVDTVEAFAKVSAENIKNQPAQILAGFNVEQFFNRASLENYLSSLQMTG